MIVTSRVGLAGFAILLFTSYPSEPDSISNHDNNYILSFRITERLANNKAYAETYMNRNRTMLFYGTVIESHFA